MKCKLTSSLSANVCEYEVAGLRELYLANYYPKFDKKEGDTAEAPTGSIVYELDADGKIKGITLPEGEKFYKIDFVNGTGSFQDTLETNGNGGKYRKHIVNAINGQYDEAMLKEVKALSLGKFVAFPVKKDGKVVALGRDNGLGATSWNYDSGAADADANGWTGAFEGAATESAPLLTDISVIKPKAEVPVVTP